MTGSTFDSLTAARDLEAAGFERRQAEALATAMRDVAGADRDEFATKADLTTAVAGLRSATCTVPCGFRAGPSSRS